MKKYLPFLILFAALAILGQASFIRALDEQSTDVFHAGHFPHPGIVILAIDNKSIQAIGRWPWERSVEARVIDKLGQYSPQAVGVDINFSEVEDEKNDSAFAKSLTVAPFRVVLPVETVTMSDGSVTALYPLTRFSAPKNVALGHVVVPLAADGSGRYFPGTKTIEGRELRPFAEAVSGAAGGNYAVNFAGPAGTFATYSISDFLNGAIPAEALQGKIVLIGATAGDLHDVVIVPGGSVMAGVEWHANIIDNILLNRGYKVAPVALVNGLGLLLAILLLLLFLRLKVPRALIITVIVLILIPLTSYIALHSNLLIPYFWNEVTILATFVGYGLFKWYAAEMEKRRLRRTIQGYFSPAVLEMIMKDTSVLSLGGETKEVTVLFSDIRSFTTITESTPPETLTRLLHEYFSEMTEEIMATDGVLDKFIGDAIMAFWGAPIEQPDHADRALAAALGMMNRLAKLQKKWADEGLPFVDIGIGVHTGMVTVGNMGSDKRFDYTVIGDTVNTASRLEGLNKEHKTHIIISEATRAKLKGQVEAKAIGDVLVKGKTVPVKIYSIA